MGQSTVIRAAAAAHPQVRILLIADLVRYAAIVYPLPRLHLVKMFFMAFEWL